MFADGSANSMGATIGTTTTAISIKSRKNPRTNITAITIPNFAQNPPGNELRKFRTSSSPPKALNAAVNIAAPSKMIKTSEVVLAVSSITLCKILSNFKTRIPLQINEKRSINVAASPSHMPVGSPPLTKIAFIFIL